MSNKNYDETREYLLIFFKNKKQYLYLTEIKKKSSKSLYIILI